MSRATVGITHHAVELLGDLVYIELPTVNKLIAFNDVVGVFHSGTSLTGDTVTLESRIDNIYKDGNELRVQGSIYNQDNEQVGEISRTFFEKNGTLNVEHGVLYIYDEEHKGTGLPGTSRYITNKNKKNTPDRLEIKKFNPILKRMTVHKEIK